MSQERRAVIDIGTNSVKVLVGDIEGTKVLPLVEKSEQTRLGRGFYESHILQRESIDLTARAVKKFAALAQESGAVAIRVIATSAARDATNAQELLDAIKSAAGLGVEI